MNLLYKFIFSVSILVEGKELYFQRSTIFWLKEAVTTNTDLEGHSLHPRFPVSKLPNFNDFISTLQTINIFQAKYLQQYAKYLQQDGLNNYNFSKQ